MLYDNGDECTEITGGWNFYYNTANVSRYWNNYGIFNKTENSLNTYINGSRILNSLGTQNFIDITNYNSLGLIFKNLSQTASTGSVGFQLSSVDNTNADSHHSDYIVVSNHQGVSAKSNSLYFEPLRKDSELYHEPTQIEPYEWNTGTFSLNSRFSLYATTDTAGVTSIDVYNIFLVKPDNYTKLLEISGINNYSSLEELISDTIAITTILNNEKAVDFMLKQCTGDFMASFIANSNCLTALEDSPYKDLVYENEHWAKFLTMAQ